MEEAEAILAKPDYSRRHVIKRVDVPDPLYDAHPGALVPVFVPKEEGGLEVAQLEWGFMLDGKMNAVFNTRIETALEQLRKGRRGMWTQAITEGRCLVPVRAFYEPYGTEMVPSPRTGKPIHRQYRFRLPGARAFLLAGVRMGKYFSVVTTAPNASVAPVHDRMPLVLGRGESSVWLGSNYAALADRSRIVLAAKPEQ